MAARQGRAMRPPARTGWRESLPRPGPDSFMRVDNDRLSSVRHVARILGISVATCWRLVARPEATFPPPIRLKGCRATRWRLGEIHAWREAQS